MCVPLLKSWFHIQWWNYCHNLAHRSHIDRRIYQFCAVAYGGTSGIDWALITVQYWTPATAAMTVPRVIYRLPLSNVHTDHSENNTSFERNITWVTKTMQWYIILKLILFSLVAFHDIEGKYPNRNHFLKRLILQGYYASKWGNHPGSAGWNFSSLLLPQSHLQRFKN